MSADSAAGGNEAQVEYWKTGAGEKWVRHQTSRFTTSLPAPRKPSFDEAWSHLETSEGGAERRRRWRRHCGWREPIRRSVASETCWLIAAEEVVQ